MNGDGREFVELKQEFRDFKERVMEYQVDVKARLASIDASMSALAPLITAHEERFKVVEQKNKAVCDRIEINTKRLNRIEMGIFGVIFMALVGAIAWGWQAIAVHIFSPKVG